MFLVKNFFVTKLTEINEQPWNNSALGNHGVINELNEASKQLTEFLPTRASLIAKGFKSSSDSINTNNNIHWY